MTGFSLPSLRHNNHSFLVPKCVALHCFHLHLLKVGIAISTSSCPTARDCRPWLVFFGATSGDVLWCRGSGLSTPASPPGDTRVFGNGGHSSRLHLDELQFASAMGASDARDRCFVGSEKPTGLKETERSDGSFMAAIAIQIHRYRMK